MKQFLSNILILIGICCFLGSGYVIWERTTPKNLNFIGTVQAVQPNRTHLAMPVEIRIPALTIDIPIIPAKINNGTWETTKEGASYLTSSPIPGVQGNSILYAHNFLSLFGKLPYSKPGEEVDIVGSDKSIKKFIILYTSIVSPTQIDILNQTKDKRITLYTCTGLFDTKRFVVVGILE